MRVLRWDEGRVRAGGRELVEPGARLWIDAGPDPETLAFLGETFGFHPLALEDCAHEDQRPKYEPFPGSLFCVVHRVIPSADESEVLSHELHAFLTADALVTVHAVPIAEVDKVFARCAGEPALLERGPDFALYLVHDAVTDVHFALVDALTEEVEALADLTSEPDGGAMDEDVLPRIVAARRAHGHLRRRLAPQREVFAALARPGQPFVRDATAVYFRDVVDHAVRLAEEVDTGRDLLASTMEAYLSRTNNRLSALTARLTLVATIFLPLNFVAGFFGMNLQIIPPRVAAPLVLVLVAATPLALWAIFRRKRWL
ncbi:MULTISPECIES: magnesium transporter CorA family protein [Anaeromyxobacter]|uniref:magnesium transporter CorA family protein n=1 Tax=Anaeromyxobacter TaxID=161492 RepID=UPI001F59F0BA|nr:MULTISPECIES: magnesium transporter CorA family protein [unclassified Anaeromyxobacter]